MDAVEIHVQFGEPGLGVLREDDARHVDAGERDLVGREQQGHVRPQAVVHHPPGDGQHGLFDAEVLLTIQIVFKIIVVQKLIYN